MPPKKMITLQVLEILRKHSDESHRLTAAQIIAILSRDYGVRCDRRSVARALLDLCDAGYKLESDAIPRMDGVGDDNTIRTNWYIANEITDGELRLLIDSVLAMCYIPKRQRNDLAQKLSRLSSVHFERRNHRIVSPPTPVANTPMLYSIETLDTAIALRRQVSLRYCSYGADMKLKPRSERVEIVNPYEMVFSNGRYYLLANYDRFDNVIHLRIEKIRDIAMLETPAKLLKDVKVGGKLDGYLNEHIYMTGGDSVDVTFRTKPAHMDVVADWFGTSARVVPQKDGTVDVNVNVNETAMIYWALQFGEVAEVLSPQSLMDKILAAARDIAEMYGRKE